MVWVRLSLCFNWASFRVAHLMSGTHAMPLLFSYQGKWREYEVRPLFANKTLRCIPFMVFSKLSKSYENGHGLAENIRSL